MVRFVSPSLVILHAMVVSNLFTVRATFIVADGGGGGHLIVFINNGYLKHRPVGLATHDRLAGATTLQKNAPCPIYKYRRVIVFM